MDRGLVPEPRSGDAREFAKGGGMSVLEAAGVSHHPPGRAPAAMSCRRDTPTLPGRGRPGKPRFPTAAVPASTRAVSRVDRTPCGWRTRRRDTAPTLKQSDPGVLWPTKDLPADGEVPCSAIARTLAGTRWRASARVSAAGNRRAFNPEILLRRRGSPYIQPVDAILVSSARPAVRALASAQSGATAASVGLAGRLRATNARGSGG